MPKKYLKKPVEVMAFQYDGKNVNEILELSNSSCFRVMGGHLSILTKEGTMDVNKGDYIIRGIQGELYPSKPDIFCQTYEEL